MGHSEGSYSYCRRFETCSLQIGIMLCGLAIDSTVIGGPAYNCCKLHRGDVILRVDGVPATQARPICLLHSFHDHPLVGQQNYSAAISN
jgi:C-terminal processing protease CtpA/Prc